MNDLLPQSFLDAIFSAQDLFHVLFLRRVVEGIDQLIQGFKDVRARVCIPFCVFTVLGDEDIPFASSMISSQ
jgi:hypothetical protein